MTTASKITAAHLERLAVVYVRQSSIAQVREHTESTARQYALAQEAARLGWSAAQISVIDADLGVSGRTASARSTVINAQAASATSTLGESLQQRRAFSHRPSSLVRTRMSVLRQPQ